MGGRSSRMGRDKALIPFGSQTLVEKIAHEVLLAAGNCTLVGPRQKYEFLGWPMLERERPGEGPLAGMEAALRFSEAEHNLILACDLPTVTRDLLQHLFQASEESRAPCSIVQDASRRIHPLCGVYKPSCLPAITEALDTGQRRVTDLVAKLNAEFVDWPTTLPNLNTPEEWGRFTERDDTLR